MGWRGALRTLSAAARESERNAKRHARQRERYLAAMEKARSLQQAQSAVRDFDSYIAHLMTIHRTGSAPIDWVRRASEAELVAPQRSTRREEAARAALNGYRPWRLAEWLGMAAKRRRVLKGLIEPAKAEDEREYREHVQQHEAAVTAHHDQKELANRLLAGDQEALREAILGLNPFKDISDLGSGVTFVTLPGRRIVAEVKVQGESIVPKQTVSLLSSGRASVKEMPKVKYYRLYGEYVCSVVLRVARELFAILPLEAVGLTATENMLNPRTGNLEDQPILSVFIPKSTFLTLSLNTVDPFESMKNFVHNMDFRASSGFRPVAKLDLQHYSLLGQPVRPRTSGT
jgi:hypothetical protein